jgi:cell division protein ZapD
VKKNIEYEQPLNERVRTFLRLEHLFDIVNYHISQFNEWNNRIVIHSLLNILDLLSRSDIKLELIKELERHSNTLNALKKNPNVDLDRLDLILENINNNIETLRDNTCQPGQIIRSDELITSIKQRSTIPGGSCNFDLPSYHFWLNKEASKRNDDLKCWHDDLLIIQNSLHLTLHMLRNSSTPAFERALSGFYQKPIDSNVSCQLIRVVLPIESDYFPEISGGKHRFTIRFMEQNSTNEKPVQTQDTVEFELHSCIL